VLAQARAQVWEQEFQESCREPERVIGLVTDYINMTDDERGQWRKGNPEKYEKIARAMRRSPALKTMMEAQYG
jgi:hypothetical protein